MKNIFSLRTSRARMILLCVVDILTIIIDCYLSLVMRFEWSLRLIPAEYMNSMKQYLVINIITTLISSWR